MKAVMPAHRLLGALSTLVEQSGEILGQNQGVHSNSSTLTCAAPSYTPVTGGGPFMPWWNPVLLRLHCLRHWRTLGKMPNENIKVCFFLFF